MRLLGLVGNKGDDVSLHEVSKLIKFIDFLK